MKFKAQYRDRSGKMESIFVDALSRSDCFDQLKAKGIVPVSVKAYDSEQGKKITGARMMSVKRIVLGCLGATVIVAVVYCLFSMMSGTPQKRPADKEKRAKKKIEKVVPVKLTNTVVRGKAKELPKRKAPELMDSPSGEPYKVLRVLPDGTEIYLNSKGEKCAFFNRGTEKDLIFHTKLENMLAWYAVPGKDIPPLPMLRLSEEEIAAGLDAAIEYDEKKDDEKSLEIKLAVAEMKEMLRDALKKGGSIKDFLGDMARRQMMEANAVKQSRALVMDALSKGKTDEAKALLDSLNKDLKESGIPQVHIHPKHWESSDAIARGQGDK